MRISLPFETDPFFKDAIPPEISPELAEAIRASLITFAEFVVHIPVIDPEMAKAMQMSRPSLCFLKIKETSRATVYSYANLANMIEDERNPAWAVVELASKDGLEIGLQDVVNQRDHINQTLSPAPRLDFSRPLDMMPSIFLNSLLSALQ